MKLILSGFLVIFVVLAGFAQNKVVEGTVISKEDKQPVPGVGIQVQGTPKGTATDADGKYKLELAPGENTLVFTSLGFKTVSMDVGDRTTVDVTLESDTQTLDEVVVVGYGVQKKSDITGAVANVKGEDLARQPVLTAAQALQGKVAGVQIISSGQPGSSPQVRVRGISTALSSVNTLYVVDGVLTDDITNINTADIVDMNILKDASASAIYGSRGANGVIIITTRKGAPGGIKVSYNSQSGFRQAANLVQMANSSEYANYVTAATGNPPPAPQNGANTDWYKTILRNAFETTQNLSLSGGSDKSTFMVNLGYLNDQGIILENNFKRFTMRANSDFTISPIFKAGIQTSFANSVNQNGFNQVSTDPNGAVGGAYEDAYRAAPIIPSYVNGLYGNTSVYQNVGNPLLDLRDNKDRIVDNRIQGYGFISANPISWLTLRVGLGADVRNTASTLYVNQFTATGANNVFLTAGGNQINTLSDLTMQNVTNLHTVWDNTATIAKKIGKHDFTFLAGTTFEGISTTTLSGSRNGVPSDPSLWYLDQGNANSSQNVGDGDLTNRHSYLTRLNYNFSDKYLVTVSGRADGISGLAKKYRYSYFPSVGLGWVISNEGFMQGVKFLDMLKLRGSWGQVGNANIPKASYLSTLQVGQAYPFVPGVPATPGQGIKVIIDPSITWERITETDVAIEFSTLGNKLSGEVNYYDKQLGNGLDFVPVQGDLGANPAQIISNVLGIRNRGVEIVLSWKNRVNDHMTYNISGNATFNQNKVTYARSGGESIFGGSVGSQGFVTNSAVGHPVGSFYALKTTGVFNSDAEATGDATKYTLSPKIAGAFKYQDTNGDGVIDLNDRVFAGSYQPVAYFGLNAGINYDQWDVNIGLYGNVGNKVYNGKKASRVQGTDNVEKAVVYDRWTPSNHTQSEPGANTGNLPASTYFVESGNFLRINNITIGYTVLRPKESKSAITKLRIFVTSQNTFTLKKYSGFTAELPGDPLSSGIENSTYPTTRTVAIGISMGF